MTNTLVIGLDAFDPVLAAQWMQAGHLPNLSALRERGAWADMLPPLGLFVGTIWPVLTRSVHPACTGRHSWIHVDPHTYELTPPNKRLLHGTPIWQDCLRAGRSVLLIDVPHSFSGDGFHGDTGSLTTVCEWGAHDHHVGFETFPPGLADQLLLRHGHHPLFGTFPGNEQMLFAPDDYLHRDGPWRTPEEDVALANLFAPGIARKTSLTLDLANSTDADLTMVVFGESHAVGHQLWHVHDASHPRHHAGVAGEIGDPIETTYRHLDESVGQLIAATSPTNIVVLLSHGMGPHYDGTHLLEAVLGRLNTAFLRTVASSSWGRYLKQIGIELARRISAQAGHYDSAIAGSEVGAEQRRTRFFFRSWNNDAVGGVRLNLQGREASGLIPPDEADSVLSWLERKLSRLVNVTSGRSAVRRMYRTEALFTPAPIHGDVDSCLPDLYIEWDRSEQIEHVWSPSTGSIRHPSTIWRTGDHVRRGAILVAGPDVEAGRHPQVNATHIVPSLARLLDIPLSTPIDSPVEWINN